MKIVVIGTRGIPDIQGGVETHCQELYPRLVALGHDVTVIRRRCYVTDDNRVAEYRGVKLIDTYAPRRKSIEAIVHTFLAVIKARRLKPDVLHIHAIGPQLMTPLARLLGMRVVVTNHGPDYDRGKWGRLAKTALKTGERWGTRRANRVIVISRVIARLLLEKYGRSDTDLIFNGVNKPSRSSATDFLDSLSVRPGSYIVALGRFVPEKGFHDLIDAFAMLRRPDIKLVIAGDADHPDRYSEQLKARAAAVPGVVLTGFIRGERLNQVMSHARLFALPSYHEGLPIALLEAMSYGLDVVASDIPANMIPQLTPDDHFSVGDVAALASLLDRKLSLPGAQRRYDLADYDWDNIAAQTAEVYNDLVKKG